jgi:hypothetical protein
MLALLHVVRPAVDAGEESLASTREVDEFSRAKPR